MKKLLLCMCVFLAACSSKPQPVTATIVPDKPTVAVLPSVTPSATFTPVPTATATLAYPVQAATSLPEPQDVIGVDNIASLEPLAVWSGPIIKDLQYAKDGKYLIVTFQDGGSAFYDMSTYELVRDIGKVQPMESPAPKNMNAVPAGDHKAVSLDGKYGANTIGKRINIYELPNPTPIKRHTGSSEYWDISFSPSGSVIAFTNTGADYWDFLKPDSAPVYLWGGPSSAYAFTPDGTHLLIGTYYGVLSFHDLTNINPDDLPDFVSQAYLSSVTEIAASPDSKYFATVGGNNQIKIWNALDRTLAHTMDDFLPDLGESGKIMPASNSRQLLIGYSDSTVRLWDIPSGTIVDQFRDPNFYRTFPGWNPSLIQIYGGVSPMYDYSASADGALISIAGHSAAGVWNTKTREQVFKYEIQSTSKHEALAPDGKLVAVANSAGANIVMFDVATGAELWKAGGYYGDMLFSPDGSLLAVKAANPSKPSVFIHDAKDGKRKRTFIGARDIVFSPNGEYIVLVSDKQVSALKIKDWSTLFETKYNGSLGGACFSPDGKILVFQEDKSPQPPDLQIDLIFFDFEKEKEIRRIRVNGYGYGYYQEMTYSFSGDGKYFVYGTWFSSEITVLGIKE